MLAVAVVLAVFEALPGTDIEDYVGDAIRGLASLAYRPVTTLAYRRTLGKRVMDLWIVDYLDDGSPSSGQLIGRELLFYVIAAIPMVNLANWLMAAFSSERRGMYDRMAETRVIHILQRVGLEDDEGRE